MQDSGEWKGTRYVGVNDLIARMRKLGSKNLAIVQGNKADWSDYPGGIDEGQVVFSGHPFLPNQDDRLTGEAIDWHTMFGEIARNKPFLITAWDASASGKWCKKFGIETASQFIQYVQKKDIGLVGFAFDSPFSMTRDFRSKFDEAQTLGTTCEDTAGNHPGDVMQAAFKGTLPKLDNEKPKGGKISISKNLKVGKQITLDVDAKDPEKDPISYAVRVDGGGVTPRQHGSVFHFTFDQPGVKKLTISVADNKGAAIRKTISLKVTR